MNESAPPARASRTICSISGTPRTRARGLDGATERSRVPWPAAIITHFIEDFPGSGRDRLGALGEGAAVAQDTGRCEEDQHHPQAHEAGEAQQGDLRLSDQGED